MPETTCSRFAITAYFIILLCTISSPVHALVEEPLDVAPGNAVANELRSTLQSLALLSNEKSVDLVPLLSFYQRRNYQPVWCNALGISAAAEHWLSILGNVERDGINAALVHRNEIQRRLNAEGPPELAELDLLLSDSFIQYARIMGQGQLDPSLADPEWHIPWPKVEPVALLEKAVQSGQFEKVLEALVPGHTSYRQLRDALADYVSIQERGGWPVFQATGAKLETGNQDREIQTLRRLLWMTGDLDKEAIQGAVYDEALKQAVSRFQKRHGLEVDGIVGKQSRLALAVPVQQRIQQIRLNLERSRWLPRDLGKRYIKVNTAAFELQVHEDDAVRLSMRVIVGTRQRETPVFTGQMHYLVVNPYWNVPGLLARRDLIPAQLRDPGYFLRKGIRVFSHWRADTSELDPRQISWQHYLGGRHLPYRLRQDPGPGNSLGRIKFMLPNPYSVYLHDTPARHLFNKPVRTFSSGCIRVEKPLALADYVLGGKENPGPGWLEALIESGETQAIRLPEPVPVYLLYQTAWVDPDGLLHFRDDIYRRDRRMAALLPIAPAPKQGDRYARKSSVFDVFSLTH